VARLASGVVAVACAGLVGCAWYLKPKCDDGIRNGAESDLDCGGACRPCDVGGACASGADCETGTCGGGKCLPLPCSNGVKDGLETDVDCGGDTCRRCAGARHCLADGDCFSGTCDPSTSACSSLGTVSFAEAVAYPSGDKTYALVAADLDGDGDTDLVAANEQGNSVSVFLNRGDGAFDGLPDDFATGSYPTAVAVADFNRDGIPDVVTADYHGNSVSVLLGAGDGTLGLASHHPTLAGAETQNLAVGDLNGDDYLDVVATNFAVGSMSLFMGLSDGTLAPAINMGVGIEGASAPFSVAIGDLDGDGKDDVAIADDASGTIIVRLGNGDGTLRPEVGFREGGTGPYICIATDIDVDGKLDVTCANRESDDVSVLLGRGDGTLRAPIVSGAGAVTGPYSIAVADFNADGVPDVTTANFESNTVSVLLGIGDGTFEAPIDAGSAGDGAYGIVAADFDRDGRLDVAVCNPTSGDVRVMLSTAH
jgi:hypothetical protein